MVRPLRPFEESQNTLLPLDLPRLRLYLTPTTQKLMADVTIESKKARKVEMQRRFDTVFANFPEKPEVWIH
jgi:hypothetical protein